MNKKVNIAIDGYSSCGKSTLAKAIAKELNYIYIDTGAMYRAMTLFALKNNAFRNDELNQEKLITLLDSAFITFKYNTDQKRSETYLNAKNVEKEVRSMQVSKYVSQVASIPEVRKKLVKLQQRMSESRGVVMDGRDIGTVVLPDAEVKFFMTAEASVRAERRFKELKASGSDVTFDDVLLNVKSRDQIDSTRAADPLRQAEGAIVIDNSHLTMEEQFVFAMNHVNKVIR